MGKGEISELSIFDFVMNLIIADIVATGIVQEEYWLDSLGGLLALVALQITLSKIQTRHAKVRKYINGEPSLIIKNGRIKYDELTKLRIQLDELMLLLRQNSVHEVDNIQYAVMELNGRLSIYEKRLPTKTFPLPLVISGEVKAYAIENADLEESWFYEQIKKHNIVIDKDMKYIFYNEKHLILHTKTDFKKLKIN
jgi:uncharacterized membrane protein YcaP (DUF421 family)